MRVSYIRITLYQYDENSLGYDGQASVAIGGAAWLLFQIALNALIILGIIQVVSVVMTKHSYDWYDAEESAKAIAADSELQKYYYPALIENGIVYIALYFPLPNSAAKDIVIADSPIDLYSYTSLMAKTIITAAGFTLESQLADHHLSSKGLQFKHYHIYYYNASNEDNFITDQSIIDGLDWMLSNNIRKVNISLSSKQYSKDLENWIFQNKDSVQIYASFNNLLNSHDYPAMYDNVIASGSNNKINFKSIDRYYKKRTILLGFPIIKKYDGNSFLSLLTLVEDIKINTNN